MQETKTVTETNPLTKVVKNNFKHYIYRSKRYAEWKESCFDKHGRKCYISGTVEGLSIHHDAKPFSFYMDKVYKKFNINADVLLPEIPITKLKEMEAYFWEFHQYASGIPLNYEVHRELHKTFYFTRGTTNQQIESFKAFYLKRLEHEADDRDRAMMVKRLRNEDQNHNLNYMISRLKKGR